MALRETEILAELMHIFLPGVPLSWMQQLRCRDGECRNSYYMQIVKYNNQPFKIGLDCSIYYLGDEYLQASYIETWLMYFFMYL
uniref:Uncharacterized protein n=1 Tax=Arundo donax TaxID=35708 RepID=A0A0A8Z605_ARUDO